MTLRPTMADVAREAGVSPSTASRVLHESGYASGENRKRVLAAASKVGYQPNLQARSLRNNRSYSLGLVIDSSVSNPHFAYIAHAIGKQAAAAGYSLLTVDHEFSTAMEREGLKHLLEHNVEAIIVCHPFSSDNFSTVKRAKVPIIQIERRNLSGVHRVLVDPNPGIDETILHLVELGHRSIGYISGLSSTDALPQPNGGIESERAAAFVAAVDRHGLVASDCTVHLVPYDFGPDQEGLKGKAIGKDLLGNHDRPSALIAGSDVLAAGLLQAAWELGISVPNQLSLVGFDDSIAKFLTPPLSTIAQPHNDIAKQVVEIAIATKGGGLEHQIHRRVSTRFEPRNSTARLS